MAVLYPNQFERAFLNSNDYEKLYQASIDKPEKFWQDMAKQYITWSKPFSKVLQGDLTQGEIKWFSDGALNVCYNCIDRHLTQHADKVAFYWEGDDATQQQKITYKMLHERVCRFANLLKKYNVKKGDRVCLYLPMIPETIYAMLACARMGAVHSVVFSGFSPAALASRINDANANVLITADVAFRGGKTNALLAQAQKAMAECPNLKNVIVIKRDQHTQLNNNEIDYFQETKHLSSDAPCEEMNAEDPLFILYTSGSTGKPKGILHTTGGYLTYAATTFNYVFNYQAEDIYWCTADVGWITGHSYSVYGPLANAATSVIFEGVPNFPDASRLWQIVDRHQVNILYTAPTLLRMLMREGDDYLKQTKRTSLKLLGSVGEPINPSAWEWFYHDVGNDFCPIVDTWWQTETGGIMITPLPGCYDLKPGAAMRPFFGIEPALLNEQNQEITAGGEGALVIKKPWPGMLRTVYGDHPRFVETYLTPCHGYYFTGDRCYRDQDGDYWIRGRIDDVLNIAGHRLGTAEIESAIVSHPHVAEAAVIPIDDETKGQAIYAFVTPMADFTPTENTQKELNACLREQIGPIAQISALQWANALPKTRSGKIMRRILRKIANGEHEQLGDTSTLADVTVINDLIAGKIN